MVAATNKTGTSILAFEYVQLKEPFDFGHHEDEKASISGNIDAIVPNPNKSRFLVMRLFISNGVIHLNDKPPKQISTRANKSLDASGGSVFLNLLDAAEGALIRAAASTQPLYCFAF